MTASRDLPSLTTVNQTINGGFPLLRFPAGLEHFFEAETAERRNRDLARRGFLSLILFDLFLFADMVVTPDVFATAVLLRLAVVTPIGLALIMVTLRLGPRVWLREAMVVVAATLAATTTLLLMLLSTAQFRQAEHYAVILVVLFATIVQRARFPYAILACAICFGLHAWMLRDVTNYPGELELLSNMIFAGAVLMALVAAYSLERESRLTYLITLRERRLNNELTNLSRHDPLTGLANRRLLDTRLAEFETKARGERDLTVLLFDVDHFKLYNDSAGHQAGDVCLKRLAGLMRAELAERADMIFRYGGEEFLVLLPDVALADAVMIAERIRRSVELAAIPHPSLQKAAGIVTVSVGAAAARPGHGLSAHEIIAGADAALYAAKRNGRNQVWPPFLSARHAEVITIAGRQAQTGG